MFRRNACPYLLIAPLSESSLEYPSDYLLAQMARLLLLVCGLSASHGLQLAQSVRPVSAATCAARAVPAMLLGMGGPQTAVPRTVGEAKALQQVTINWRLPCLGLARRAHPHERGRSRSARTRPPQGSLGGARGRLTTHRPPLTTHRSPITDHRSLLTAHRSPRTAHGSRFTARRSPLTARRSPITGGLPGGVRQADADAGAGLRGRAAHLGHAGHRAPHLQVHARHGGRLRGAPPC